MEIEASIREFVAKQILDAEGGQTLDDRTPLFSSGLLDSISKMKLISFLERQFGIVIESEDATSENLETISSIAGLVRKRKETR